MGTIREYLNRVFYNENSKEYFLVNYIIFSIIIISIITLILGTEKSLKNFSWLFSIIEGVTIIIFGVEYILRILGSKEPKKYIFSFLGVIDLIAFLPGILGMINLSYFKIVRFVRILSFLRILKLSKVIYKKDKDDIFWINFEIILSMIVFSILISSSLIWFFEGYRTEFSSIPLSMLWSIKVLLGGVYQIPPETIGGEFVLIFTRFSGLVLLAFIVSFASSILKKIFKL